MNKMLLLILDGWGVAANAKGDAIQAADTPYYDSLLATCPHTLLEASGVYVGLPEAIMGNSEVGHENIGAGRINKQKLTLISDMVRSGEFFENVALNEAIDHVLKHNSRLHFMGLISEGDVHSHLGHLDALIELSRRRALNQERVYLHAISDGRDDPPRVAGALMSRYQNQIRIATVSGRYWAMDRDNNWDRLQRYTDCVLLGHAQRAASATEAVAQAYAQADSNPAGSSDEFILPTLIDPEGLIRDGDAIVFFNFRPDRAKQISKLLGLDLKNRLTNLHYVCFTDYSDELALPVAFSSKTLPKQDLSMSLGEYISSLGLKQFRVAETEKFNHVTSFFNQRRKQAFPHEDWCLVPSPKVTTYDLQPEMSIDAVVDALCSALSRDYDLIVCNFANPDMVGHTGNWSAVLKAISKVDLALRISVEAARQAGYIVAITADHGNADQMYNTDASIRTAHSCNPVPFILVGAPPEYQLKAYQADPLKPAESTTLACIAPSLLKLMGLTKPKQMGGDLFCS